MHNQSQDQFLTPPKENQSVNVMKQDNDSANKSANKQGIRKALESKFKIVYESPNCKKIKQNTFENRGRAASCESFSSSKKEISRKQSDAKLAPNLSQQKIVLSPAKALSECSKCSGAKARGMEYICLNCENKEMIDAKREATLKSRRNAQKEEETARLRDEELRKKEIERYSSDKKQKNATMRAELEKLESNKKDKKQEKERDLATSLIENGYCKEYNKKKAYEKQKELEKMRKIVTGQLLERQLQESAKKEKLQGSDATNKSTLPSDEMPKERYKQKNNYRAELLNQIAEKSALRLEERKNATEHEKKIFEELKRMEEKHRKEQIARRQDYINNSQNELKNTLENNENKKREEKLKKEEEKNEIVKAEDRHKELFKLYSAEKSALRDQLAKHLQKQIQDRLTGRPKEIEEAASSILTFGGSKNLCPHGKKYVCAHCNRTYPRELLSKRMRNYKL